MSEELNMLSKLDWAINTIRDQLLFGRDEIGGARARELRAKGVMLDAVKYIKELEERLTVAELNSEKQKEHIRQHHEAKLKDIDTIQGLYDKLKIAVEALENADYEICDNFKIQRGSSQHKELTDAIQKIKGE